MASDLPDMRPSSSIAFARLLVQTMRCDHAVRQRIKEDFSFPPTLRTIRQIRIEMACSRLPVPDMDPFKAYDGYYPNDVSDAARVLNNAFLEKLRAAYPERFAA